MIDFFRAGSKVKGISDVDNEWYPGVVERVEGKYLLIRFKDGNT